MDVIQGDLELFRETLESSQRSVVSEAPVGTSQETASTSTRSSDFEDNNLDISTENSCSPCSRQRATKMTVISKIEKIFLGILDGLEQDKPNLCIPLEVKKRRHRSRSPSRIEPGRPTSFHNLSFPGDLPREAWRFCTADLIEFDLETKCLNADMLVSCRASYLGSDS